MPYIPPDYQRDNLTKAAANLGSLCNSAGELNFALTRVAAQYLHDRLPLTYERLNEGMGVLVCVKDELFRRVVAVHEDNKCAVNGDVFPSVLTQEKDDDNES